jgi:hypothetical protein
MTNQPRATPEDQCVVARSALKRRNNIQAYARALHAISHQSNKKTATPIDRPKNRASRWVWPLVTVHAAPAAPAPPGAAFNQLTR